jgi:hypothetical protein
MLGNGHSELYWPSREMQPGYGKAVTGQVIIRVVPSLCNFSKRAVFYCLRPTLGLSGSCLSTIAPAIFSLPLSFPKIGFAGSSQPAQMQGCP